MINMAYTKKYDRINWMNEVDGKVTAMGASNFNKMDYAIYEHDKQLVNMDSRLESQEQTLSTIEGIASASAKSASESADSASLSATTAKLEAERAKTYASNAEAVTSIEIATKERAGIIKGGDILIDEGGVLQFTTTTTSRELTESKAGGIRIISMDGESQQKQYSGKNLYDEVKNNIEVNHSGIKFTKNEYGNLTLSGTTTASINAVMNPFTLPAGTYYYQKGTVKNVSVRLYNRTASAFIAYDNGSFTLAEESTLDVRVQSNSGSAISGTIKIQIEKGSTMTEYEPYVGGIASPNPEYEQAINSVEIKEIGSHGKNLWNLGNVSGTRSVNKTFSLKAGTYTVSAVVKSSDTDKTTSLMNFVYADGSTKGVTLERNARKSKSVTFTQNVTNVFLYAGIDYQGSTDDTFSYSDIQIEKGSVATPFEEFKETRETLSAPIVLRGIGDVKDTVAKRNGVYGVLRKFDLGEFNDISKFVLSSSGNYIYLSEAMKNCATNDLETNNLLSNYALKTSANVIINAARDYGVAISSKGSVYFRIGECTTKDEYENKVDFSTTPLVVVAQRNTPTFEPLPLADQIALHKLESFGGVTYLFTDSTIEPIIEVEYGTSKVGGYAIKGLNNGEISLLELEQLKTLTNELATQLVAGSEA